MTKDMANNGDLPGAYGDKGLHKHRLCLLILATTGSSTHLSPSRS